MGEKLPLLIVTGASGVGKSTVMHELRIRLPEFVVFSTDDNFGTTAAKLEYQDRFNLLLHFASAVALSGRGTIICGTMKPWDAQKCAAVPFAEVDLPFMLLKLRQGVGRLIRTREDRGMVSIVAEQLCLDKEIKNKVQSVLPQVPWKFMQL